MLQHYVVTRLGIGITNPSWFESALALFEGVTFPSLKAQTSQDFTTLLMVDHEMPPAARDRLSALTSGHRNFHIVPIDLTQMVHVHHGCFDYIWDRCQDYLLARRLVEDPFDYVITSVLDGDDAWHHDTVALVNQRMIAEMPEFLASERRSMTWLRHTGGMCLTFPTGLKWFAHQDIVEPFHCPFHSMSVFVAARFSSGISACSSRHSQWPSYCGVLGFRTAAAEEHRPMWTYVRHNRTEVGWETGGAQASDTESVARLRSDFGIDFEKVAQWHRSYGAGPAVEGSTPVNAHVGMPGTEQLDCYFRITALNRQISNLKREAALGDASECEALIIRQTLARDALVKLFRRQAHAIFR